LKDKNELKYYHFAGFKFPFKAQRIFHLTLIVWTGLSILLFVAMLFFGYERTNADIPGGFIAGILLAYLIFVSTEDW